MNREELREQLLAPVLQWTRLGRQTSRLMTASNAVISYRSRRLLRAGAISRQADWDEVALMTREKVEVPLEAASAVAVAMLPAAKQFWTHAGLSMLACSSDSMSLLGSRNAEEFRERQAELCATLINVGVGWWRAFGGLAEIGSQGMAPLLREVQANAERLAKR
ncbi:MAG: hypothetical protein AW10_00582 [Candidatus Accumulibacter appositus]|uniref:Phasin domain-containing protein n=1 Tax=Candidatus Accumulibacter appositus TaxID=1454003 RepID=A0A011QUG8_9PROT|nr:hypothetical protein [Accumulibacter sp.]EXI82474.1 MAG: hypothetical protein AW10_00582 [Candidatus Accumulibacter appositus]HRF03031.1 hypothetical protein [Accumulibacter sp.]